MLKDYLDETLKLDKIKRTNKNEGGRFGKHDTLRIRNNDEMKVRAMDNLFQSLANLIYFFEFLNHHPEIIDKFLDDIEDLLGVRLKYDVKKNQTFERFIYAVLGYHGPEYDTDNRFNFQRRCMNISFYAVGHKIAGFTNRDRHDVQFKNTIKTNMFNARTWADYFDNVITGREKKKPNRVLDI